ncbi:MAG: hypothetical protein ACK4ZM_03115, partial [bacterium]
DVKNNVNINHNVVLKTKTSESSNLNVNFNTNNTNNSPLTSKIADTIGYAQDVVSSTSYTVQEFIENKPDFAFKTIAENLKDTVMTGSYSTFTEVVDKLLLGALRGVSLGLSGWTFIKKIKDKTKIQKSIEEKLNQLNKETQTLSPEQKAQLQKEIEKLTRELDEKKLDLGISGSKVITDALGIVGAVAAAFSLPALATAAPYLVGIALVGDIVSLSYYAYRSIKKGVENLNQKILERRNKELTNNQVKTD